MNSMLRVLPMCAALLAVAPARAETRIETTPAVPVVGREVAVQVRNEGFPNYIPASRFSRVGNRIVVEQEFVPDAFGPWRQDFGKVPVSLGELPPGDYQVSARVQNLADPSEIAAATTTIRVAPPSQPGLYTVPSTVHAGSASQLVVVSALPVDSSAIRVAVGVGTVRVDFRYGASVPADKAAYFSVVNLPALAQGKYRIEAWGASGSEAPQLYFSRDLSVALEVTVVEYYHAGLDHYFIASNAADVAALDRGEYGGWMRTGKGFRAWPATTEYTGLRDVCRFYSPALGSHRFTLDPAECDTMKRKGEGWQFEGVAFQAMAPLDGRCAEGTSTVTRFSDGHGNDRFTTDGTQYQAMRIDWKDEGAAFCVPG